MSYIFGENLIATVIKTDDDFNVDNTDQAKWTFLNKGKSDHYAILKSGGTVPVFITPGVYQAEQRTIIEVWQRYKDDGDTAINLYGYVDTVLLLIQANKKLGDTTGVIQQSTVEAVEPVLEMWMSGGGPAWLRQSVIVLWHEQVSA